MGGINRWQCIIYLVFGAMLLIEAAMEGLEPLLFPDQSSYTAWRLAKVAFGAVVGLAFFGLSFVIRKPPPDGPAGPGAAPARGGE